ncbi:MULTISPECIES: ribosomal-processing cysteine protease Prp [Terrabacteria group]|uniref:ribosomal-processing cysteine protease Prp n=1 Tax=Bacillati TaxID=1783272 RepID=UPI00193A91CE|nr:MULTISPECIES: ribosomal-processing cysteine protease Prp [Terrabacteria group]MBW9211911.1 ribosomal-processing cysteine protease Prp [Trueperella sp. zg.1013]QRG87287.1 ribosomal-processing cysteine protease Prp [Bulleidia sp. zg-1006]
MIQIRIQEVDGHIIGLHFSGHAYSNEPGKDLVCAAISSIAFGILNALEEMKPQQKLSLSNNAIDIEILDADMVTDTILRTAYIQCETVRNQNQGFIQIKKEKVK